MKKNEVPNPGHTVQGFLDTWQHHKQEHDKCSKKFYLKQSKKGGDPVNECLKQNIKQVGYIKPVWRSADLASLDKNGNSQNITFDYGLVKNMHTENVFYPILITIGADPAVDQNMSVSCSLTLGQDTLDLDFDITPVNLGVSFHCKLIFWDCLMFRF